MSQKSQVSTVASDSFTSEGSNSQKSGKGGLLIGGVVLAVLAGGLIIFLTCCGSKDGDVANQGEQVAETGANKIEENKEDKKEEEQPVVSEENKDEEPKKKDDDNKSKTKEEEEDKTQKKPIVKNSTGKPQSNPNMKERVKKIFSSFGRKTYYGIAGIVGLIASYYLYKCYTKVDLPAEPEPQVGIMDNVYAFFSGTLGKALMSIGLCVCGCVICLHNKIAEMIFNCRNKELPRNKFVGKTLTERFCPCLVGKSITNCPSSIWTGVTTVCSYICKPFNACWSFVKSRRGAETTGAATTGAATTGAATTGAKKTTP